MKICPACGADILDSATVKCSSCGSDLEVKKPSRHRSHDTRDSEPTLPGNPAEPLEDTEPILKSDDLEVVQGGQAFWTEPQESEPDAAAPSPDETDHETEKLSGIVETSQESQESQYSKNRAPSLSDLARTRNAGKSNDTSTSHSGSRPGDQHDGDHDDYRDDYHGKERRGGGHRLDDTDPSGIQLPSTSGTPSNTVPSPGVKIVSKVPDVAYIDGNSVTVPGAHWSPGQDLVISGRTYNLKRKSATQTPDHTRLMHGLVGVVVGVLIGWLMMGEGGSNAKIFGMVRDQTNGNLLAGVRVAIEESDQNAQSGSDGIFRFKGLEEGVYTLVATDPIYGESTSKVTVSGDATVVVLGLERTDADLPPIVTPKHVPSATTTAKSKEKAKAASATKLGKLAVTASVANAKIYIDDQTLGIGNSLFGKIRPGTRRIRVAREGFETWEKKVVIKSGETTRIEPRLVPISKPEPVELSHGQYAFAGRGLLEQQQYKAAVEQFDLAIASNKSPQYFAWRAAAQAGQGNVAAAEADFLKAAALFEQARKFDLLEKLLLQAVATVPTSSNLEMELGDQMYRQRMLQSAERHYRKALDLGHSAELVYISLGLTQYAGGSYDDAVRSWEYADKATGGADTHIAGYLVLGHARLQHRTSSRNMLKRLQKDPQTLAQFRAHPDWNRVQRLTGGG